jgi:hypothetical protein
MGIWERLRVLFRFVGELNFQLYIMKNVYLIICSISFLLGCGKSNNSETHTKDSLKLLTLNKQSSQVVLEKPSFDNQTFSLGIGLIIFPEEFEIFEDSLLTNSYVKWNMYSGKQPSKPLVPKYFKPDYGIMHFICLEKTSKYFKIFVNDNQVKYVPTMKSYQFVSWENYILNSYGIRKIKGEQSVDNQFIMQNNDLNSVKIALPKGQEMFCPMYVKGDWVKVKYDCFYNEENNPHEGKPCQSYIEKCQNPVTGWCRWRERNIVLIDIFLMP